MNVISLGERERERERERAQLGGANLVNYEFQGAKTNQKG